MVIPSKGRATLERTVRSLSAQTNPQWNAFIVFDGVDNPLPELIASESRITVFKIPKAGRANHGGLVRNYGLERVKTAWAGFVDDDDTLGPDYVEKFFQELKTTADVKCIIFRMYTADSGERTVLPNLNQTDFSKDEVGISFAMHRDLFASRQPILFVPGGAEDFVILDKIRTVHHKMVISPFVTYFVRQDPITEVPIGPRALINAIPTKESKN